jgi:hypothetical protein
MGFEDILRFIIPLAFVAIWAWASTLNRNGRRLASRPSSGSHRIRRIASAGLRSRRAPSHRDGPSGGIPSKPRDPMWDRDLDG